MKNSKLFRTATISSALALSFLGNASLHAQTATLTGNGRSCQVRPNYGKDVRADVKLALTKYVKGELGGSYQSTFTQLRNSSPVANESADLHYDLCVSYVSGAVSEAEYKRRDSVLFTLSCLNSAKTKDEGLCRPGVKAPVVPSKQPVTQTPKKTATVTPSFISVGRIETSAFTPDRGDKGGCRGGEPCSPDGKHWGANTVLTLNAPDNGELLNAALIEGNGHDADGCGQSNYLELSKQLSKAPAKSISVTVLNWGIPCKVILYADVRVATPK